ncbi:site-specific integrase [Dyella flagellata]|uniref:site-specific integrase n=1 Tax=Dyella flagellata TaxID=1867833 RepID=UPI0024E0BFB4|nr:site-specific integrase [Dyella flagellata]
MASITRTTSGTWRVRVRLVGGRSTSANFGTKAEAVAWAAKEESAVHHRVQRDYTVAEKTSLRDLLMRYEREVASKLKSSAVMHYHLARFVDDLGHLRLSGLTPEALTAWRDERLRTVSPATVRRELQTLGSVMTWARKDLLIAMPENPVSAIRLPPAGKARDRRLEEGEEARLMKALGDHSEPTKGAKRAGNYRVGTRNPLVKPVIQFAIESAMRLSEIVSLRWEDVDLEAQTAFLPDTKNGDSRTVPLSKRAVAVLNGLPRSEDEPRVFPVSANAVKLAWRRATARAGITDLRIHDQRHEATSRIAKKIPNLVELASVTGHKDLRMLQRYYHPRAEDLAKKLG